MNSRIAIIEDDPLSAQAMAGAVKTIPGVVTRIVAHPDGVAAMLDEWSPTVILLDLTLPGRSGESVLEDIHRGHPHTIVVVATGINDAATAVRLLRSGAFDYLTKPLEITTIRAAVERSLRHAAVAAEQRSITDRFLRKGRGIHPAFANIVTVDPFFRDVLRYAEAVSASPRPVLILGETGTGKDLVAQAIHEASGRSGSFVACNVGGLDDNLASDALFGHKRGAFTGATDARAGLVEAARGGTLFLDEVGDLPPQTQTKLLRLLQDGDFFPVGDDLAHQADVRILAATSQHIDARVEDGRFRSDLYYRLAAHRLELPPLRERPGDLPILTRHLAKRAATAAKRPMPVLTAAFLHSIASHDFPGNVRELDAYIADSLMRNRDGDPWIAKPIRKTTARRPRSSEADALGIIWPNVLPNLEQVTEALVCETLRRHGGNQSKAASVLGITRQAISYRVRKGTQSP